MGECGGEASLGFVAAMLAARRARKWSQADLAREAGMPLHQVSRIEQRAQWPRLEDAATIAATLGLSLDEAVALPGKDGRRVWQRTTGQRPDCTAVTDYKGAVWRRLDSLRWESADRFFVCPWQVLADRYGPLTEVLSSDGPHETPVSLPGASPGQGHRYQKGAVA